MWLKFTKPFNISVIINIICDTNPFSNITYALLILPVSQAGHSISSYHQLDLNSRGCIAITHGTPSSVGTQRGSTQQTGLTSLTKAHCHISHQRLNFSSWYYFLTIVIIMIYYFNIFIC